MANQAARMLVPMTTKQSVWTGMVPASALTIQCCYVPLFGITIYW